MVTPTREAQPVQHQFFQTFKIKLKIEAMSAKLKKKLLLAYSHEDYAKVKAASKDAGLPVSTYIRLVTIKSIL
jgi:hypothetical protein